MNSLGICFVCRHICWKMCFLLWLLLATVLNARIIAGELLRHFSWACKAGASFTVRVAGYMNHYFTALQALLTGKRVRA